MRAFLRWLALVCVVAVSGCDGLTTVDSDDLAGVEVAINAAPQVTKEMMARAGMNGEARKWLQARNMPDEIVGRVRCDSSELGEVEIEDMRMLGKHVLQCLQGAEPAYVIVIVECIERGVNSAAKAVEDDQARYEDQYGLLDNCHGEVEPSFSKELLPPHATDPSYWRSSDMAKWLIALSVLELQRMPSLMHALGISTVGGLMVGADGISLLLCPLSDAVVCPDDPAAPGVPQTGGEDGDR